MTDAWLAVFVPIMQAAVTRGGNNLASPLASGPVAQPEQSIAAATADANSDARTARNAVFAEAFGSGLLYSVNYERVLAVLGGVGLRAGVGYFTYAVSSYGRSGNLSLYTSPLVASWYWGSPRHKLQLGLGATVIYLDPSSDSEGTEFGGERAGFGVAASGVVGYRYLPPRGGLTFGAGFTPMVRPGRALAWGGANVGYLF